MNSRVKSYMEIPSFYRATSQCLTTSLIDVSLYDDSCRSSAATSSTTIQNSCGIQNFDTSSELSREYENYSIVALKSGRVSFNRNNKSQVSENEGGSKDCNNKVDMKQHRRYKSLLSMIKILKNFSMGLKNKPSSSADTSRNSIYRQLRRPREYVYVKGMSGLSNRIEKVSTSSCNRCSMRNG